MKLHSHLFLAGGYEKKQISVTSVSLGTLQRTSVAKFHTKLKGLPCLGEIVRAFPLRVLRTPDSTVTYGTLAFYFGRPLGNSLETRAPLSCRWKWSTSLTAIVAVLGNKKTYDGINFNSSRLDWSIYPHTRRKRNQVSCVKSGVTFPSPRLRLSDSTKSRRETIHCQNAEKWDITLVLFCDCQKPKNAKGILLMKLRRFLDGRRGRTVVKTLIPGKFLRQYPVSCCWRHLHREYLSRVQIELLAMVMDSFSWNAESLSDAHNAEASYPHTQLAPCSRFRPGICVMTRQEWKPHTEHILTASLGVVTCRASLNRLCELFCVKLTHLISPVTPKRQNETVPCSCQLKWNKTRGTSCVATTCFWCGLSCRKDALARAKQTSKKERGSSLKVPDNTNWVTGCCIFSRHLDLEWHPQSSPEELHLHRPYPTRAARRGPRIYLGPHEISF